MTVSISVEAGRPLEGYVAEVATLQSQVFRAYPHLCNWDAAFYERLLRFYTLSCEDMILVLARDGDRLVGASTGRGLHNHLGRRDEAEELLSKHGYAPREVFYCADSVLLPDYRGRGIGAEFFRRRELHAHKHGYSYTTFCAVQRADHHELKPANYRSLESFWFKRGYVAIPGLELEYRWTDIGESIPSPKLMQFYVKSLIGSTGTLTQ